MALIKTAEEFRKHVSVNASMKDLNSIMADVLLVERDVIKKHLGAALYNDLHTRYEAGTLNEKQAELLDLVQYSLANLAQVSYLALNQVQISAAGIAKSEKAAYRYQVRELRLNLLTKGYNGLESVLEFLEEHKNETFFADWATFSAVVVTRQFFINSARQFSAHYNINDSRLTYIGLQSIIRKVEPFAVEPVLGPLYQEIRDQVKAGNVSADNEYLLENYIRPAVAHLVAAKAIAERSFKFNGDTISLNLEELVDDSSRGAEADNNKLLLRKIEEAYTDGCTFLSKLKDYLNKNASAEKYQAYYDSALYAPADAPQVYYRNPSTTKTFAFI